MATTHVLHPDEGHARFDKKKKNPVYHTSWLTLFILLFVFLAAILAIIFSVRRGDSDDNGIVMTSSPTPSPTAVPSPAPVPANAFSSSFGPLRPEEMRISFARTGAGETCPVGCHEFSDPFMMLPSECKINFRLPENTDGSLFDNTTDICADTDRHSNGAWLYGDAATGISAPWPSRTWDYMTMETTRMLWDIARTEVQLLWGHTEVQNYMSSCVRAYTEDNGANGGMASAVEERAYVDGITKDLTSHRSLMRVWGRMAARGFVTPIYVSVERKSPTDHTKRLVFTQQDGLIGTTPSELMSRRTDKHRLDLLGVARRLFSDEAGAQRAVDKVIAIETRLAGIYAGTLADTYLEYVKTPSEFAMDVRTFDHFQSSDLGAGLNMTDYYAGMAAAWGWDEAKTRQFLSRVRRTDVWAFKPEYFQNLGTTVYTIPVEDWKLYCEISIMYDTMQFVPQAYAGRGVDAAHATTYRYREQHSEGLGFAHARGANDDAARHRRMMQAYASGNAADRADVLAEEIEHADIPKQGMKKEWMMPNHAIRKPLWRTMAKRERRTVPQAMRHPPFVKMVHRTRMGFGVEAARRTDQGLDSLSAQVEHSVFAETCAMLTYTMMPGHFDQLFVRAVADDETLRDIEDMTHNLLAAAREIVDELPFSAQTRAEMRDKLDKAKVRIGSQKLQYWFDPASAITDEVGSLLHLSMKMRMATVEHSFDMLFTDPTSDLDHEHDTFSMPASIANAWFSPQDNTLNLAAGIFLDPLYHKDFSPLTLYSRLGAVAAHEIGHSFDVDSGMEFDSRGSVRQWVAEEDVDTWNDWISCLIRQYSKRTRNGNVHDGLATIAETMADNFGIKITYRALTKRLGRELSTDEKRRFAESYSQLWAQRSDPDREFQSIMYDEHPIASFRVNEVLRNLNEFAVGVCGEQPRCVLSKTT